MLDYKVAAGPGIVEGTSPANIPPAAVFLRLLQVIICEIGGEAAPMPVASLTQKGWCPRSVCSGSGDVQLVQQLIQ
jgi:hypothetical protein